MKKIISLLLVLCMAAALIIPAAAETSADAVDLGTFSKENTDEAAAALETAMINRETAVTFQIVFEGDKSFDINGYCSTLLNKFGSAPFEYSSNPVLGDYLAQTYDEMHGNVNYSWRIEEGYTVTFTYDITYRTNKVQEDELTAKLTPVVEKIIAENPTDYDRIKAIHKHILDVNSYDYKSTADTKYTAYGAEILGSSVCQGYAILFYRMCLMAGINCRIIMGKSVNPETNVSGSHAWNIVRLYGNWYNIDCTWDDSDTIPDDAFFLRGSKNFNLLLNHVPGSEYSAIQSAVGTNDYIHSDKDCISLPGDVDFDGTVSVNDARNALRIAIKLETIAEGTTEYVRADFDGDGTVGVGDARLILRVSIGLD